MEIKSTLKAGFANSFKVGKGREEVVRRLKGSMLVLGMLISLSCPVMASNGLKIDLGVIAKIESSGNPLAIGDNGKALGMYQLHKAVVIDYNKATGSNYKHKDMLNASIAYKVANWYFGDISRMLRHYGKPVTVENILTAYNMGIGNAVKGRKAVKYIAKYNRITKG